MSLSKCAVDIIDFSLSCKQNREPLQKASEECASVTQTGSL